MEVENYSEVDRIEILKQYYILNTPPEKSFDDIAKLAAQICDTKLAGIGFVDVDSVWYKASYGITLGREPLGETISAHAVRAGNKPYEIEDARQDPRFKNIPYVINAPYVVSYYSVPLVNPDGYVLGILFAVDDRPRILSQHQKEALEILASQVMTLIKLNKKNAQLEKLKNDLELKNLELEQFAYVVAHDIKNPVGNILLTVDMLRKEIYGLSPSSQKFINYLTTASNKINELVNGILLYHSSDANAAKHEPVIIPAMLNGVADLVNVKENIDFSFPLHAEPVYINKTALEQIFINLISNAIKYNDKPNISISVVFDQCDNYYRFRVKDNGRGIAVEDQSQIFNLFTYLPNKDRYNAQGMGIGLATVKKLVEALEGEISLTSEPGIGSEFTFTVKKTYKESNAAKMLQNISTQVGLSK